MPILAWRSRPEARWAFWAALAGALGGAAVVTYGIFKSSSSTAAIGFLFLPFVAIAVAAPTAVWGAALGHVALHLRGQGDTPRVVLVTAIAASCALPALVGMELWRGVSLEREVKAVLAMDGAALEAAFERGAGRQDPFVLAAMAQSGAATPHLLDRLARLDRAELYEPMGSLWDVKGRNTKGHSAMSLVAGNRNTQAETLARLEAGPNGSRVLMHLLGNPNTPLEILRRYAASPEFDVQWGLSTNPRAPREIQERLARSDNRYIRLNLTYNRGTPPELLERLAQDPDELVVRNATQALQRRKSGSE